MGPGVPGAHQGSVAVEHTDHYCTHDWPAGTYVRGGTDGLVLRRGGGTYRTAFVEVVTDDGTFIRGEGAGIVEAEDAAWGKWQRVATCPGHEYETRGYRNGAGFCRRCDRFQAQVFDVTEVSDPCTVCGVGCYYTNVEGSWYCQVHAPTRRCEHGRQYPAAELVLGCECD